MHIYLFRFMLKQKSKKIQGKGDFHFGSNVLMKSLTLYFIPSHYFFLDFT